MPPSTRLSGGGFGSNHSPSNLDHILENFNQFKRKHITQNRDIIKTNALAQLRIKELEEKILQLEGERAEKTLEMIRVRANLDRVERATKTIMRGWQMIGSGINAIAAIEGIQVKESNSMTEFQGMEHHSSSHLKPSSRIVLDLRALPGGVSRSVARAPEAQLGDLAEEDSREGMGNETEEGIDTVEADDTEMIEEEDTNDVSFAKDDTVKMDAQLEVERCSSEEQNGWMGDYSEDAGTSLDGAGLHTQSAAQTSSNRQNQRAYNGIEKADTTLRRATSIDSLSSFADDEEVQLSDDVDDEDILKSILQESKRLAEEEEEEEVNGYPAKNRKKTTPSTSERSHHRSRSSTPSLLSGTNSSSENDSPQITRSSRRSSARNGKSINYALPKLNTKMRKPDPSDLIPAKEGEVRKVVDSETGSAGDSSREVTPKRTLKGKNEAASTGNLREIRRQHQARSKGEEEGGGSTEAASNAIRWGSSSDAKVEERQVSKTRRRSSTGPQPKEGRNSERDEELQDRSNFSDSETMADVSSSWTSSAPISGSWKSNPLSSSSSSSSKSAANGTPIPRSNTGQHIKALKVANRIQKGNFSQPNFSSDGRKVNGRPVTPAVGGAVSNVVNGKVLLSSSKSNQSKTAPATASINGETKRNSLHAAMTFDDENGRNLSSFSGER